MFFSLPLKQANVLQLGAVFNPFERSSSAKHGKRCSCFCKKADCHSRERTIHQEFVGFGFAFLRSLLPRRARLDYYRRGGLRLLVQFWWVCCWRCWCVCMCVSVSVTLSLRVRVYVCRFKSRCTCIFCSRYINEIQMQMTSDRRFGTPDLGRRTANLHCCRIACLRPRIALYFRSCCQLKVALSCEHICSSYE